MAYVLSGGQVLPDWAFKKLYFRSEDEFAEFEEEREGKFQEEENKRPYNLQNWMPYTQWKQNKLDNQHRYEHFYEALEKFDNPNQRAVAETIIQHWIEGLAKI